MSTQALANSPEVLDFAAVLTGSQIRAARALLRWSASELAAKAGLSYAAIQRAEQFDGLPNMQVKSIAAIKGALEAAGIVFLNPGDTRDGGAGVRFR